MWFFELFFVPLRRESRETADIAQVLVMGAQAARSATVLLLPE